jgi:hypothetical protein
MLIGLVRRAVELQHLRSDLDVEQFVWELCGIYLSHHAAHRFLRSADADQRARTAFKALVARALAPHGKGASAIEQHRTKRKSKARRDRP